MFGAQAGRCFSCGKTFLTGDCILAECPECGNERRRESVSATRPLCTLTGVDDTVAEDTLWAMARDYPFVEWGVLYSENNQGTGRYLSYRRIEALTTRMRKCDPPNFALHICGRAVRDFINGADSRVMRIARAFKRIQLNFRYNTGDLVSLRKMMAREQHRIIITQHNSTNRLLWRALSDMPNHAVLFDESGGRGQVCTDWPEPLNITREQMPFDAIDPMCGYAGGLGPDNLVDEIPRIYAAANGRPCWMDMETRLRDDQDRFDTHKAQQCLEIVHNFSDTHR